MSIADELGKLDALRKSGVLTEEEFEREKANLLGGVPPLAESGSPSGMASPQGRGWWQASDGKWYSPPAQRSWALETPTLLPPTLPTQATSSEPRTALGTEQRQSNTSLIVVITVVLVVIAVGVGAFFLVKGSASKSRTDNINAAQSNLQTALTAGETYFEAANQTYAGILNSTTYSNIVEIDTGLSFVPGSAPSTNSDKISIAEYQGQVLTLTAYAPAAGICFGIIDVTASSGLPSWLTDNYTGITVGTYYFQIDQASVGSCIANEASGAQTLYTNGWR